jgi:KUP system potassium uptake protein
MSGNHNHSKFSAAGVLITLGIIFGDIGTSPLYVIKAIIGEHVISKELVYGGMSCVFWTLMITTTFKYVYLALNADNKGEGGIFALYALLRRYKIQWTLIAAMIGCAALIADGFITPPISISSAIEGLTIIFPNLQTVPIVIAILTFLFLIQQFGTNIVGKAFGPIMFIWFTMIGVLGFIEILNHPSILQALNPYYAFNLLANYPSGFWLLGAVFLCTTGGEAMYSDLGHCGKQNIRVSWSYVIICLLLNYFGQSAFVMTYEGSVVPEAIRPFYGLMPEWFLIYGIAIATVSAVIASQALITGCFTLVNEAMKLRLWINLKVNYPTVSKGQIYIPAINWFLFSGCLAVVLIFQKSANMEAAYGLAITIDMLITTSLLSLLLILRKKPPIAIYSMAALFVFIEGAFFISNLKKFTHGGWFTTLIGLILFIGIYCLYRARKIRDRHIQMVKLDEYVPILMDLSEDETVPREATNLVYMAVSPNIKRIDSNIMYSIFKKTPKRADVYWFVHVDISDEPYEKNYTVKTIVPKKMFFVNLTFGFKVEHKVNLMFSRIVEDMVKNGEVDQISRYPSLRNHNMAADFKFIMVNSKVSADDEISYGNQLVLKIFGFLKSLSLPNHVDFGLEMSNVEVETVPINVAPPKNIRLERKEV